MKRNRIGIIGMSLTIFLAFSGCWDAVDLSELAVESHLNWSLVSDSKFNAAGTVKDITWSGSKFVAVGEVVIGSNHYPKLAYSSDGANWTGLGLPFYIDWDNLDSLIWGGNKFIAIGRDLSNNIRLAYSSDGMGWHDVADSVFSGYSSGSPIHGIAWSGNKFVATLAGGGFAYSSDGISWTKTELFDETSIPITFS